MTVREPTGRRGASVKSPRCRICERAIHVPKGWTQGPAVRRHYWAKHRDVMRPAANGGGR